VLANVQRIQRNRELNGEHGFTLIELLIVIVVLGILAAIVVFALGGVTSSSAAAACATDAQSVNVAIAAEQAQAPGVTPIYASGSAPGDLAPAYLSTLPSSSSYIIGISGASASGANTTVTLVPGDPGYVATETGSPLAPNAEQFNGVLGATPGAFQFPAATPATSYSSKGVCAGA